jgi:hypothetical protein
MQKIKTLLLLPALFIFPYIMSSMNESDDVFYSFSEPTTSTSLGTLSPIPNFEAGTSSGSGDDDKSMQQRWSPESKRSKKPIIPKLTLTPREESNILKQQENHEKISPDRNKQQKISKAIELLKQPTLDSTRSSEIPLDTPPSSEETFCKRRFLSQDPLTVSPQTSGRTKSTEQSPDLSRKLHSKTGTNIHQLPLTPPNTPKKNLTPKTGSASISQHQSIEPSPQISPRNVIAKIDNKPEASSSSSDQRTSSPIHTPSPSSTPPTSLKTSESENYSPESLKIPQKSTTSQEKQDDIKINNTPEETNLTSMRPLTWKDGGTALLTIAGLLSLLYYLDKLPASISAKIDILLATLRMNG